MIVRGFPPHMEVDMCFQILNGRELNQTDTVPWKMPQSLTEWTLRALGATSLPPFGENDSVRIVDLSRQLMSLVDYASDGMPLKQYEPLVRIAQGQLTLEAFVNSPGSDMTKPALRKILTSPMDLVCMCADVVATTPQTSAQPPYSTFNSTMATGLIIDEAESMTCADGIMIIGNTPRPDLWSSLVTISSWPQL